MKISYKTKPLSPLLKATIKAGALDAVKLQIERGAQLNAVDSAGLSALMLAAILKQPDIFQYLIETGASLELIDSKGMSAIDYAEASGVEKIKEIIREVQNKTTNATSEQNLSGEAISDQIINQSTESKIGQEIVSFKTTIIEFEDSKEIEKEQNLIQDVDSHLVDFNFELDEDLSSDPDWASDTSDHWCGDEEIEVPENDLACLVEAETIYNKIVNHQILDIDTIDWSDIEIDLPVSQQRIINIKDEFSHLYYLLIQSTIKGMVSYSQVLQAIKNDIGETDIDTVLPVILNLFGDLGVLIEDFKPFEANYEDDDINPSDSLIEDSLINLNYELEGDLFSLNIYFSQIQKFELIERDEEERIGLQMNITLLALAKNIANLPAHYWSKVVDIFENSSNKEENKLFVEESEVDEEISVSDEIENNEISEIDNGNSLETKENNETLNFGDIVIQLRKNHKSYESNQYIPRPKIKDLDKLLKIVEEDFIDIDAKEIIHPITKYKKAREKLIKANFRLVNYFAKKYALSGVPLEDLIQEGNIGLLTAVDRYDYQLGYKFSTYATWWIKQSITRAIANTNRLIRLPVHMYELVSSIEIARQSLEDEGLPVTISSLAHKAECSELNVRKAISANHAVVFFDDILDEENEYLKENEIISPFSGPEDVILAADLRRAIYKQLAELDERPAKILELRFGLKDDNDLTLEEVGSQFNVTRERIRQIEAKALKKLRHISRSEYLEPFITFIKEDLKEEESTKEGSNA
ncbi:sigma-70 family RNA polymerase sigma factor [Acinetobacter indicus]|uniref:sigma-70 family RNA polymerase sigma factor n=1 Tax=Acinetobacter indicus TaxID=756892 RepID=UPI00209B8AD2|nr:sigma-70 family RNA polymerase sigma factor [Acinetobacter indicus]MCO8099715.1 sigma-70 family RNA polymerase sigma factor [Acinetobacter indicus]MCO8105987.1 sigma-70 family RNA polymerase sigma factor [Acinetobacter indicus]MCO8111641.1 sigma-70 family RNA polymerase sigma factor [Acinetobacter indicus]